MPQNHALFKGKLQVRWSLLGIEERLFFSLFFFFPQLKLRRETSFSEKDLFLFPSILEKKNPSSFFGATALAFLPPSVGPWILPHTFILIRDRFSMR